MNKGNHVVDAMIAETAVETLLRFIGENPDREGLRETPARVVRSYVEMFAGYTQRPQDVLKVFEDGACDEQVIMRGIHMTSTCEHHMLPFSGVVHIGYIPRKRIVGASKLVRLLEVFSKRLQVQERLTTQVTQALDEHLQPLGSACVIEATHACFACRGVRQSPVMVTSSLTGAYREEAETRAEFLRLIGK
jgi:GTP cyclohydrolase I